MFNILKIFSALREIVIFVVDFWPQSACYNCTRYIR